ncbi:cytochrome P450 2C23-like [Malaclemys terrapin pileata]|uniref:cytochrome P450 2C23-like n=1 Tax=Malaclemys terrapin pileata TaxID=2991368 RepID=UPI0023A83255|nr:cytochrome P450 2C23-like [Malaclemys terrapin pileata]
MEPGAVLITGCLLLLLFLLLFRSSSGQGPGRLPPGPAPLPVLGNLTQNVLPLYRSYRWLCQEYGPIFTVWLGPRPTVVLCGYEVVHDALVEHSEEFSGRAPIPLLKQLTQGYGFVNTNGERWRQLRRFTLTTLRNLGMGKRPLEQRVQEEAQHLAQAVADKQGHAFDPVPDLTRAVANVICSVVMGTRFSSDNEEFQELQRLIMSYMCYFRSLPAQLYNTFPGIVHFLPGQHWRIFREYERFRAFIQAQMESHRRSLDPSTPRDLIDYFFLQQAKERGKEQTEFEDQNLLALVSSLFVAGIETTSNTVQFALLVIGKFPDMQARVHGELDREVGRARPPALEDRLRLPYTNAVLHELQRYVDVVPTSLPHTTTRPTPFRGYLIPQGTTIIPLLASVHFDPASWETPEDFNPGHFLDENGAFRKRDTAMPFSAGKRMCPGEGLAKAEIFLFITTLLQSFTLELLTDPGALDLASLRRAFRGQGLSYKLRAVPRPV